MPKGVVLDEAFLKSVGLDGQLMTLCKPLENKHHSILQEPIFHLSVEEVEEEILIDRQYIYDHQVVIKPSYGKGTKVLVWLQRTLRKNVLLPNIPSLNVLMARDIFMLNDWREFQRFKHFIKSMRILDAQARNYLAENHADLPAMANNDQSLNTLLDYMGHIADWPDLDGDSQGGTIESVAKTYNKSLRAIRSSPILAHCICARDPDIRLNLFRIFSFVTEEHGQIEDLIRFMQKIAEATHDETAIHDCAQIKNPHDLEFGFSLLRKTLMSLK